MKINFIVIASIVIGCGVFSAGEALACDHCSIDRAVYDKLLNRECQLNISTITDHGAHAVALKAKQNKINVDAFVDVWEKTCDYDSAVRVGQEVLSRRINLRVYDQLLNRGCLNRSTISDDGAQEIARIASEGKIDVTAFTDVWEKTCNFDAAKSVATYNVVSSNINKTLGSTKFEVNPAVYRGTGSKGSVLPATDGGSFDNKAATAAQAN